MTYNDLTPAERVALCEAGRRLGIELAAEHVRQGADAGPDEIVGGDFEAVRELCAEHGIDTPPGYIRHPFWLAVFEGVRAIGSEP